ncbi:HD domain-containing protein [Methylococcus capsulatus]|uniref:HD domain-containing protein n=1 Tax=Methylococcus capsulatus TaxID=414 RepID=UPI001C52ECEE|nr:hypothetical protein KW112_11660 [Methylococcus capsulatus]QXP93292.1 hypothetical protein KW113_13185 [Methylococcus capsulatus]
MADRNQHAYFRYWSKARKEGEPGAPYHLLPYHCLDVAAVGQDCWNGMRNEGAQGSRAKQASTTPPAKP